jgi:uncharacterized membrane protein YqjE
LQAQRSWWECWREFWGPVTIDKTIDKGRGLAAIVTDARSELVEFVQTRFQMLKEEVREKNARLKIAGPLLGLALVMIGTAFLLITMALVAIVAALFVGNNFRWVFGFGIVGIAWAIVGAIAGYLAKRELELKTLMPKRTLEVLKADKDWFQREVKIKT